MDYIEDEGVELLSETWDDFQSIQDHRNNLFRDLSRIMLSLSQIRLPRIGSFTLDMNGILRLTNRPLTLRTAQLENNHIPTPARDQTYSATEGYYLDILSNHDNRIRHQPNSMSNADDGRLQIANLTMMRALLPHFTDREYRDGPFVFQLTDLHPSNIFVDDDWNIKCIIDLEWACSLPVEMLQPPCWVAGAKADEPDLVDQRLNEFQKSQSEFMKIFEREEADFSLDGPGHSRSAMIKHGLKTGRFWYFEALNSYTALFHIFRDHVQPMFAPGERDDMAFMRVLAPYWDVGVEGLVGRKRREMEVYQDEVGRIFEVADVE